MAENEVIFRNANEGVVETLETTRTEEKNEKIRDLVSKDLALLFYCECADDKCKQRIKLTVSDYVAIHRQSNEFVIVPGHEIAEIEKVTRKESDYYTVQKYFTPPQKPTKLHPKDKNI